jgi:hypothetical protein
MSRASCLEGDVMSEEYWKKPDPQENEAQQKDSGVGVWSRSRALRVFSWILALIIASGAALFVSAYLSGFDSVFDMFDWLRKSL